MLNIMPWKPGDHNIQDSENYLKAEDRHKDVDENN